MITVLGKLKKMMDQFLQIVAQDSNETGDKVKGFIRDWVRDLL